MTYAARRTIAIALASAFDGWGRPPNPEGRAATLRIITLPQVWGAKRFRTPDRKWMWGQGYITPTAIVPNTPALDEKAAGKERRQNREKF